MRIICDYSLHNFPAWSGAVDTKEKILAEDKEEEFEQYIEDIFPDGCTDTQLNDILWFEEESIFEYLDINGEDDEEIDEGE